MLILIVGIAQAKAFMLHLTVSGDQKLWLNGPVEIVV
jgi:hypothetical protein